MASAPSVATGAATSAADSVESSVTPASIQAILQKLDDLKIPENFHVLKAGSREIRTELASINTSFSADLVPYTTTLPDLSTSPTLPVCESKSLVHVMLHHTPSARMNHQTEILQMVSLLTSRGMVVHLDMLEQQHIDRIGRAAWIRETLCQSNKVLILATPQCLTGPDVGLFLMENEVAASGGINNRFIPVIMSALGGTLADVHHLLQYGGQISQFPKDQDAILRSILNLRPFEFKLGPPVNPADLVTKITYNERI